MNLCLKQNVTSSNDIFPCRAMPQTSCTISPILLSPCLRCSGGLMTLKMTLGTRSCFPSQLHQCLALHSLKIVSTAKQFINLQLWPGGKTCNSVLSGTVPEERYFTAYVGTFLHDVQLINITLPNGVFTVEESNARGFLIHQHLISNGSMVFSIQVPFDSDAVLKHVSLTRKKLITRLKGGKR